VREETGATGAKRGTDAVTAVLVSVKSQQFVPVEIITIDRAE
jgi:hypothetical protein